MKRYRVLEIGFDARANLLSLEIGDDWAPEVKAAHHETRRRLIADLRHQFGELNFEQKFKNFLDLGIDPISIVAFHNIFLREARHAFVIASYYPALTGVCALGERILNHLVHALREDFRATPEYRRVADKKSVDDWGIAIATLKKWGVLESEVAKAFDELRRVRHGSLHFRPEVEGDVRPQALAAIKLLQHIVDGQFGVFGAWHIRDAAGLSLVRKDAERLPFVRRIVIPRCAHVGPEHDLVPGVDGRWIVSDHDDYPDEKLTDEEWVRRFKAAPHAGVAAGGRVQVAVVT